MSAVDDDDLKALTGTKLVSHRHPGVEYALERVLGEGSHGVAFMALRGPLPISAPVVIKLLRPRAIRDFAQQAAATIEKEVRALERLSERFPPTPHVVRFLDAGSLRVRDGAIELPWLAIEYVSGGRAGTTLRARVATSLRETGHAFGRSRAYRAAQGMIAGIEAIHEVGVLHRDVSPGNVLCSGAGEDELFRIADLGLARVESAATFGKVLLGTPGYCAPEQSFPGKEGVGPYSDVFGIACCIYFALTGDEYFDALTIPETLVAAHAPERPRLAEARGLCRELALDPSACRELDAVLAHATRGEPRERIPSAKELGDAVLPILRAATSVEGVEEPPREAMRAAMVSDDAPLRFGVRRMPDPSIALRSVACDADGHFLAVTSEGGLCYWDGWLLRAVRFDAPSAARVVMRAGLRHWIVRGDDGILGDFHEGRLERTFNDNNPVRDPLSTSHTPSSELAPHLRSSVTSIDPSGGTWAGTPGELWFLGGAWTRVWNHTAFNRPFVAISADADTVTGVTADGGVVRGERLTQP